MEVLPDEQVLRASMTDPAAFEALFDRYHGRIWAFLARSGGRAAADDLDDLTAARPEATPTAATTARHRAALRAGWGQLSGPSTVPGTAQPPESDVVSGGRRWLAAAAAVAVVAGGIGLASSTCGPVRFRMPPPPGFADGVESVEGEQVVTRYEGTGGATIELRWPSRRDLRDRTTGSGEGVSVRSTTDADDAGVTTIEIDFVGLALGQGPCDTIAATVVGPDAETAGRAAVATQDIVLQPGNVAVGGEVVPLVVSTAEVDSLPTVGPCENGAAIVGDPTWRGPAFGGPDPVDALQPFLDFQVVPMEEFGVVVERPRHPTTGYEELVLPDGTRAYAHHPNGDAFVGTLVVVRSQDGGWLLDRWEASAC